MPSRFPGSEIDLTVTHPLSVPWEALASAVREGAPAELLRVDAKYLWRGAGVPEGHVKTTLTVAFGSGTVPWNGTRSTAGATKPPGAS